MLNIPCWKHSPQDGNLGLRVPPRIIPLIVLRRFPAPGSGLKLAVLTAGAALLSGPRQFQVGHTTRRTGNSSKAQTCSFALTSVQRCSLQFKQPVLKQTVLKYRGCSAVWIPLNGFCRLNANKSLKHSCILHLICWVTSSHPFHSIKPSENLLKIHILSAIHGFGSTVASLYTSLSRHPYGDTGFFSLSPCTVLFVSQKEQGKKCLTSHGP